MPGSIWGRLPVNYFIAFIAYALILLLEKVAFDSHSLIEHEHQGPHSKRESTLNSHAGDHDDAHKALIEKSDKLKSSLAKIDVIEEVDESENTVQPKRRNVTTMNIPSDRNPINNMLEENYGDMIDEDSDIDEETFKDVISSRGKFASYLQSRNICN